MGTTLQISILITAMLLGLLLLLRLRLVRIADPEARKWDRRVGYGGASPFHAVSIEPHQHSCLAAKALKAQRFLSEEAPALPLIACAASECQCKYIHYPDRRSGDTDRRLGPVEESDESEFWGLRNRRSFRNRRLSERQVA